MSNKEPAAQSAPGREKPLTPKLKNSPIAVERFSPEVSVPAPFSESSRPLLSIVLIVYKMPNQAEKTLYSLSTAYQQGVSEDDYEVIVVENSSSAVLGEERALQYGGNVRYFYREETRPTPVPAINFGAEQARGSHINIMVDGARMLSPAVVSYSLAAMRLHPRAVIAVPGYHLGPKLQQRSMLEGYCEVELDPEAGEAAAWVELVLPEITETLRALGYMGETPEIEALLAPVEPLETPLLACDVLGCQLRLIVADNEDIAEALGLLQQRYREVQLVDLSQAPRGGKLARIDLVQ